MSFVAELKQRKVFRVATVYLIAAWIAVVLYRYAADELGTGPFSSDELHSSIILK